MKKNLCEWTSGWLCLLGVATAIGGGTVVRAAANDTNDMAAVMKARAGYGKTLERLRDIGDWREPEKVLPEVKYEGLPVAEVGDDLKKQFQGEFDVLYPCRQGGGTPAPFSWEYVLIDLRLRNVKASEIFTAMNLMFETGKTPVRWELLMNGNRSTALLQDISEPTPADAVDATTGLLVQTVRVVKPMVFFVGDLVGDPKAGGMSMDQIFETVSEVCGGALSHHEISSHKQAQLLIIRGTEEEIRFVQNTLMALREKASLDGRRKPQAQTPEPTPKPNATSTH